MGSPNPSIVYREACYGPGDAGSSVGEAFQWKDSPLCGSVFLVGEHVKGSLGEEGMDANTNASEFGMSGKASCQHLEA